MRRLYAGAWILGGFLSSGYALGYRTIDSPTANLYEAEVQTPVVATTWDAQDLTNNRVACTADTFFPAHSWTSRAA